MPLHQIHTKPSILPPHPLVRIQQTNTELTSKHQHNTGRYLFHWRHCQTMSIFQICRTIKSAYLCSPNVEVGTCRNYLAKAIAKNVHLLILFGMYGLTTFTLPAFSPAHFMSVHIIHPPFGYNVRSISVAFFAYFSFSSVMILYERFNREPIHAHFARWNVYYDMFSVFINHFSAGSASSLFCFFLKSFLKEGYEKEVPESCVLNIHFSCWTILHVHYNDIDSKLYCSHIARYTHAL